MEIIFNTVYLKKLRKAIQVKVLAVSLVDITSIYQY